MNGTAARKPAEPMPFPHHVQCAAGLRLVPRPTESVADTGKTFVDGMAVCSAPDVHWASVGDELVALDLRSDRFLALDDIASRVVFDAFTTGAAPPSPRDREILDALFAEGLLVTAGTPDSDWAPARQSRPEGVSAYGPQPLAGLNTSEAPRPTPAIVAAAATQLAACEVELRRTGIAVSPRHSRPREEPGPDPAALLRAGTLVKAHLMIRRIAPRPVDPLAAAAALARHAWQAGLPANLVVGVQKYPFHTRVFVELHGCVLDDAQELVEALAPILVIGAGR